MFSAEDPYGMGFENKPVGIKIVLLPVWLSLLLQSRFYQLFCLVSSVWVEML